MKIFASQDLTELLSIWEGMEDGNEPTVRLGQTTVVCLGPNGQVHSRTMGRKIVTYDEEIHEDVTKAFQEVFNFRSTIKEGLEKIATLKKTLADKLAEFEEQEQLLQEAIWGVTPELSEKTGLRVNSAQRDDKFFITVPDNHMSNNSISGNVIVGNVAKTLFSHSERVNKLTKEITNLKKELSNTTALVKGQISSGEKMRNNKIHRLMREHHPDIAERWVNVQKNKDCTFTIFVYEDIDEESDEMTEDLQRVLCGISMITDNALFTEVVERETTPVTTKNESTT